MSLSTPTSMPVPYLKTSLVDVSNQLPFRPPCRILFKKEAEQPCGSFKLRGISNLIDKTSRQIREKEPNAKIHVYASSGGNAGLAAAYSSNYYNVDCTVAVPAHAKPFIVQQLKDYGANVIVFGKTINEADGCLRNQMENADSRIHKIYCHPFNDPMVWEGHATMIDELAECEVPKDKIKGIVCSMGGGGLYNGLYDGLKNNNMKSDILIIETNEAPTFAETLKKGEVFILDHVKSVATSLACSYLSEQSLKNYHDQLHNKTIFESISDFDAIKAVVRFHEYFNEIIEPACGVAACVALNRPDLLTKAFPNVKEDDVIVVVVCGGSCTDEEGLDEFRKLVYRSRI